MYLWLSIHRHVELLVQSESVYKKKLGACTVKMLNYLECDTERPLQDVNLAFHQIHSEASVKVLTA